MICRKNMLLTKMSIERMIGRFSKYQEDTPASLLIILIFAFALLAEADVQDVGDAIMWKPLKDGQIIKESKWQELNTNQVEQALSLVNDLPISHFLGDLQLVAGIGPLTPSLAEVSEEARRIILSDSPDSVKELMLGKLEQLHKSKLKAAGIELAWDLLKAVALDDDFDEPGFHPDQTEYDGIYEIQTDYITADKQKRTLFCGATVIKAPISRILDSLYRVGGFKDSWRADMLEIFVVENSYREGRDKQGNPVKIFEVQFTRSQVPQVGMRSARLQNVFRRQTDQQGKTRYIRIDTSLVSIPKVELERLTRTYGESAAIEFRRFDALYQFLPIEPIDSSAEDVFLVFHIIDVNPNKRFENSVWAKSAKRKELRLNLINLKARLR